MYEPSTYVELRLPLPAAWLLAAPRKRAMGLDAHCLARVLHARSVMTRLPQESPPFDVTSDARSVSRAGLRRLRTRQTPGRATRHGLSGRPTMSILTIALHCRELHEPAVRHLPTHWHHDPSQS
jgi:hypothetical protein